MKDINYFLFHLQSLYLIQDGKDATDLAEEGKYEDILELLRRRVLMIVQIKNINSISIGFVCTGVRDICLNTPFHRIFICSDITQNLLVNGTCVMRLSLQRFNIYEWIISRSIEDIRKELEKKKCEDLNNANEVSLVPISIFPILFLLQKIYCADVSFSR